MSKPLVLLSGGLDSTTALALAVSTYEAENVKALTITYGQKHDKEIQCAVRVSEYYQVPFKHITLPDSIWSESKCTLLKGREGIEESSYAEQVAQAQDDGKPMIDTSIPFRNGVFIAIAAAVASSWRCDQVVIAAHQDDSGAAYPDCSPEFLKYAYAAIKEGTGFSVALKFPFLAMTKKEIVKWGLEHNVPYHLTWSCYNGRKKACGKCATCLDRLKAFKLNNAKDPIEYEN